MKAEAGGFGTIALSLLAHLPCCGVTLALAFGAATSGFAWLEALEHYRPVFIVFSLGMAAFTLWSAFRKAPHEQCNSCCSKEQHVKKRRNRQIMAVVASVLAVSTLLIPHSHEGHDHEEAKSSHSQTWA